jgi:hypothetical protein
MDAYLDTKGNMHILYWVRGPSTNGIEEKRHRLISSNGELLYNGNVPEEAGEFCRLFQDAQERFYLLGSAGLVYPAGKHGGSLGEPIALDLSDYPVEYSGFGISVPRTGTPLSTILDVVFPSGNWRKWVYFRLHLSK